MTQHAFPFSCHYLFPISCVTYFPFFLRAPFFVPVVRSLMGSEWVIDWDIRPHEWTLFPVISTHSDESIAQCACRKNAWNFPFRKWNILSPCHFLLSPGPRSFPFPIFFSPSLALFLSPLFPWRQMNYLVLFFPIIAPHFLLLLLLLSIRIFCLFLPAFASSRRETLSPILRPLQREIFGR